MKDVIIIFITGEVLAPLRFLVLIDQPQKVKDELFDNLNLITRAKTEEVNTVTVKMIVCVGTYDLAFFSSAVFFPNFQVSYHLNLHLSIVMLVSIPLVSDTFLSNLLVVHCIRSLVD